MKEELVHFKFDGEWLTKFFRTRFWDEKCGYDKAIKLISDCFNGSMPEEMCVSILEGRKKLVGVNEFDYVDDNEHIIPITNYIREQEEINKINKIVQNIELYPKKYIDLYACTTSKTFIDGVEYENDIIPYWYQLLVNERGDKKDVLENGCIWFDNLKATAKMIMRHTDKLSLTPKEFLKVVFDEYEEVIEGYRQSETPFDELTDYVQAIICRNRKFAFSNKIEWSYLNETVFKKRIYDKEIEYSINKNEIDLSNNNPKNKEELDILIEKERIKRAKEFANNPHMNKFLSSYGMGNLMDILKSEPFDTSASEPIAGWDGYIDRDGNFYKTKPIGVGWYNGTANCHDEWAVQYLKEQGIDLESKNIKNEKDYIIDELGWCDMSHFVIANRGVYVNHSRKKDITKKQIDALTKLFELNNDSLETLSDLLEN